MKIEGDPSKLQINSQPDLGKELQEKLEPPTINQDSLEQGDSNNNIFQQPFTGIKAADEGVQRLLDAVAQKNQEGTEEDLNQPKASESSGGGGAAATAEAAASEDGKKTGKKEKESDSTSHYTIIDSSFGRKPVVIGGKDELPDDLRDLGSYEGGTDIAEFDWYLHQRTRISEAEGDLGKIYANIQLQAVGVQGRIFYTQEASLEDLTLKGGLGVEGKIELVGDYAEIGYKTPSIKLAGHDLNVGAKLNIDLSIGAKGFGLAEASVGKDTYLKIGGEAFVGATLTVEGEVDLGEYADAHAGYDAYAGVGAKGGITIGLNDGELTFDAEGGLALGLGIGFDAGIDVDLVEIGETIYDLGKGGADATNAFGSYVSGAGDVFGQAADVVGDFVSDAYSTAADAAGDAADAAGEAAEDTSEAVSDMVEDGEEAVSNFVEDAADW